MATDCNNLTIQVATSYADRDEEELLMLLARQQQLIELDPAAGDDPTLDPDYRGAGMPAERLRAVGLRIMREWNRRLYDLVCGAGQDIDRQKLVDAFGLGQTALIGAVASALLALNAPAAIAAAAAAIIVRHFLVPAGGIVCDSWAEAIELDG